MTAVWRIVKKSRAGEAFSGEGARRYGGRWNHRGTAVVYVADSLSLAALELFVHIGSAYKGMELRKLQGWDSFSGDHRLTFGSVTSEKLAPGTTSRRL